MRFAYAAQPSLGREERSSMTSKLSGLIVAMVCAGTQACGAGSAADNVGAKPGASDDGGGDAMATSEGGETDAAPGLPDAGPVQEPAGLVAVPLSSCLPTVYTVAASIG